MPELVHSQEKILVPPFVGRKTTDAKQLGRATGLRVEFGVLFSDATSGGSANDRDFVSFQYPRSRTSIIRGSLVGAWVIERATTDQRVVEVVDFRGTTIEDAIETAKKLKLKLFNEANNENGHIERVIDQYPRPGQKVYEGTHLLLVVEGVPASSQTHESE